MSGVSLKIKRNTIYGLLGPNGMGKFTTLKLIPGPLRLTEGETPFDGEPWKREHLAKIGSLTEGPALYGDLTAEENLFIHTKLLSALKDKTYKVLETVDPKDTGSRCVSQLSHGMKERLGTAIALLNDPSLLILDEPTNGLDPVGTQELHELIVTFPERGMTVIFFSHIPSEVERVVNEIGIINKEQLILRGIPNRDEDLEAFFMEVIKEGARR